MAGDDEGARSKPDGVPDALEPHAVSPIEQVPPDEPPTSLADAVPTQDAAAGVAPGEPPSQASPDDLSRENTVAHRSADTPSLTPVWAVLIAGFVVLGGALLYLFSLTLDATRIASLENAVTDLRSQVTALQARPVADTAGLTQRLDAAGKQIAGLASGLDALRNRPAPQAAAAPPPPNLAPLEDKLGTLEIRTGALEKNLGALRTALPDTVKQATAPIDDRVSALSAKIDGLPKIDLGPLTAKVDGLDQRFAPIEAEYKAAKSPERVTAVRQNGSAAETRAAPLAVTAEAVQRAIDAGRPFGDDLQVMARLGADATALAPLRAVAETGAPTIKDLRADLAELRAKITVETKPAATGSYLDRLMSGATSLVQVRPLGSVVGDSPPAVLARLDDDLARDDLAAATAEWARLPADAQATGKSFAERLHLRLAAETAARTIGAQAIQAMASDQP